MKYTKLLRLGLMAAAIAVSGCSDKKPDTPKAEEKKSGKADEHEAHGVGPNGGVVFDLGKHHAEFTVDHDKKECMILVMNGDHKGATELAVVAKELTVTTKATKTKAGKAVPPMTITLLPRNAKDGKASKFFGTDPGLENVADFEGTVFGEIDGKPSQGEFKKEQHDDQAMGTTSGDGNEAEIYLNPGGIYTAADIQANGNTTVSAKYKKLKIAHDFKPKVGDKLCPVTMTKANPDLKWVIGGKTYIFCCPPCVEEFVTLAKTKPDEVKAPETYVKK